LVNFDTLQSIQNGLTIIEGNDFSFRYKEPGMADWSTIPVTPSGSTQVTINRLTPDTTYEFQVVGKNALGDGMLSKVISIKTLGE